MTSKRKTANVILIVLAAAITILCLCAAAFGWMNWMNAINILFVSVLIICVALAVLNYKYSSYGNNFSSRYPDPKK